MWCACLYSQNVSIFKFGAILVIMLPFFSSRKNLFIIGSIAAVVPEMMEVEEVGATANRLIPHFAKSH